ncbi:MAG: hypothetical protein H6978_06635 [Gammaproteobacteria bacterium]|nr:hypothetical protein [Gammaproteobacteria bacterium]
MTDDTTTGNLARYRKKQQQVVTAVQLALDTDGFTYRKWGGVQRCKPGDWIVNNDGDVYTVDAESFADTYAQISPGRYVKTAIVWAEVAANDGAIETKEGATQYSAGDYIVYNGPQRTDGYAVKTEKFQSMYEPAD